MQESLWLTLLAKLAWACQHIGLDLTAGLALISAATGSLSGWALRRTVPAVVRTGWRAASGTWRWAFSTQPLSPVAESVLRSLESRSLRLSKGALEGQRFRASYRNPNDYSPTRRLAYLWITPAGATPKDALPFLSRRERKLIEAAAYAAGVKLAAVDRDCDRMEILDALDTPPLPPSCTVATSGAAESPKWDLTKPPPGVKARFVG